MTYRQKCPPEPHLSWQSYAITCDQATAALQDEFMRKPTRSNVKCWMDAAQRAIRAKVEVRMIGVRQENRVKADLRAEKREKRNK